MPEKDYLGDGVYVRCDGNGFILTTEDGVTATNTIYLEMFVLRAFQRYVERCFTEAEKKNKDHDHA